METREVRYKQRLTRMSFGNEAERTKAERRRRRRMLLPSDLAWVAAGGLVVFFLLYFVGLTKPGRAKLVVLGLISWMSKLSTHRENRIRLALQKSSSKRSTAVLTQAAAELSSTSFCDCAGICRCFHVRQDSSPIRWCGCRPFSLSAVSALSIQWPFGRAEYAHSHYASIMADVQITH